MNRALLAKLAWRVLENPSVLQARMLWGNYGSPLVAVKKYRNVSPIWKGIDYDG